MTNRHCKSFSVTETVVPPGLAGTWYEADAEQLARRIDAELQAAVNIVPDTVRALILPHAGHCFSGPIAAHGVAQVRGRRFRRVIVMAPSHRAALPLQAALPDAAAFATPLGRVPLDRQAVAQLAESPLFACCPAAFDGEHSIEIQLPILQRALREFSLLPLIFGRLDDGTARSMARVLLDFAGDDTLVVVSSDFTHYGKSFGYCPFGEPVADNIRSLDEGAFAEIAKRNSAGFLDYCTRTGATICGRDPIAVLLSMLPDDAAAHRIEYTTSGHLTGDFSHCVSYLAAAFVLPSGWPKPADGGDGANHGLNADEKRALLLLARRTIESRLAGKQVARCDDDLAITLTPALRQKRGAFVTLYRPRHCLRGCIGEILPRRPLYQAVAENAIRSAFHDPRFPPLQSDEWPEILIEISALTPPRPVASCREIELGRHGIVMEKDSAGAVYLPQVATEQNWTLEQTLASLSRKAGLPPDAWQEGAAFTVFEAEVFRE